ncbi:zinc finger protein 862-like [Styela clava]
MEEKSRSVSVAAWKFWPNRLKDSFTFGFNEDNTKVVHAACIVCKKHCDRIQRGYGGKVVNDVTTYGENGTIWILRYNLERHLNSEGHLKCVEIENGKLPTQTSIARLWGCQKQRAENAIKPLVRTALYVSRKELPFNAFADLLQLCADNGGKITTSYGNREGCKAFIHILAEEILSSIRNEVHKKVNFFSWMVDGSTVVKRKLSYESELIYIRIAHECKPAVHEIDLISMKEYVRVDANNLYHATLRSLLSFLIPDITTNCETPIENLVELIKPFSSKIIGAGADGAAVNFGRKTGLLKKWEDVCPGRLIKVHCYSHRIELASKDALTPHFKQVIDFLIDIYYHFRNSPKEWAAVCNAAEKLQTAVVSVPKSQGTRFVAHTLNALHALKTNWIVYIHHFTNQREAESDMKAEKFLVNLHSFKFYILCRQYEDIVNWVSATSIAIQSDHDGSSIIDAIKQIKRLKMKLTSMELRGGPAEREALDAYDRGDLNCTPLPFRFTRHEDGGQTKAIRITCKRRETPTARLLEHEESVVFHSAEETIIQRSQTTRSQCIRNLRDCLDERFTEIEEQENILSKLSWLNPEILMSDGGINASVPEYGNQDLSQVFEYFKVPLHAAGCEKGACLKEWDDLKYDVQGNEVYKDLSTTDFWHKLHQRKKEAYKNLLIVVELVLCLPFSNAVVERGFSCLRRILTDWRSHLGHNMIKDLLLIATRKEQFEDGAIRENLVNKASARFMGSDGTSERGLVKRRINSILGGLETAKPSLVQPQLINIDDSSSEED